MSDALILVRFFHFAATMFVFGALAFRQALATPRDLAELDRLDEKLRSLLIASATVSLATALLWLMLEAGLMSGDPAAMVDAPTISTVLTQTAFGSVWAFRLVVSVLLIVALTLQAAGRRPKLLLAMLLLASLGMVGHAVMDRGFDGIVHRANHAAHLLAAGAWTGGLAVLAMLLFQSRDAVPLSTILAAVRRFSTLGYAVVALVLASGLVNCWFLLPMPADLISTGYGLTLTLKIVFVTGMLALALFHRASMLPWLAHSGGPRLLFFYSLLTELALAFAVIAVASVLGTLPPMD